MTKLTFSPGDALTLTAPAGGVVSGTVYLIGDLVVVSQDTAAAGEKFVGISKGVFDELPADSADTWVEGEELFWDDANSRFTDTSASGLVRAGVAGFGGKAASATVGPVVLGVVGAVVP